MAFDTKKKRGPNFNRLMSHKMAKEAIPDGGGLADGIKFLSSKESILAGARAAAEFTERAIEAVRNAAEPNPWRNADDEAIAGELLRQIEARKLPRR